VCTQLKGNNKNGKLFRESFGFDRPTANATIKRFIFFLFSSLLFCFLYLFLFVFMLWPLRVFSWGGFLLGVCSLSKLSDLQITKATKLPKGKERHQQP